MIVAGAKKDSVLSAGWFIGMMVAIAILLLILIIVCIVKRNRGKEYKCKSLYKHVNCSKRWRECFENKKNVCGLTFW